MLLQEPHPAKERAAQGSVLVVSNVFPPQVVGGAELVALRQALALRQRGFDVSVFAGWLDGAAGLPGRTYVEDVDGLRVFRIVLEPTELGQSFVSPSADLQFRQVLRAVRPGLVHFHNLTWLGAGLIPLARASGARAYVTLHDTWGFCLRQTRLRDGLELCRNFTECDVCLPSVGGGWGERVPVRFRRDYVRWCLEHAERLIFPSQSLLDSYAEAGLPAERFARVSNGINLDGFPARQRDPQGEVRFLAASSLAEHKGVRVLWDALRLLLDDEALAGRWSMVIAGDGPLAPELRALFEDGALRTPVSWAGNVSRPEMQALHAQADAFVLASICPENEPVSLIEALASGAAQIGTQMGGIPELIEDGRTGCLVPPHDPAALAGAMRRMILEPGLVRAFSARNIERRASFGQERCTDSLAGFFAQPALRLQGLDRRMVLCTGSMQDAVAGSGTSRRLRGLDERLRLLWHDWVDPAVQDRASLLCLFEGELPFGALGRAIRSRIPVIAPRAASLGHLPGLRGLLHEYEGVHDALDLVERLAFVEGAS